LLIFANIGFSIRDDESLISQGSPPRPGTPPRP